MQNWLYKPAEICSHKGMGKGGYLGGHTLIGPGSDWFKKPRILEDEANEGAKERDALWRERLDQAYSEVEQDIERIPELQDTAKKQREARTAKRKAKRLAKEREGPESQSPRPTKNVDRWLNREHPDLARQARELFGK